MPPFRLITIIIAIAILAYPVADFVRRMGVATRPISFNDQDCAILNRTSFSGLEDMTKIHEDADCVDLIASYEPRISTWLDTKMFEFEWPMPVKTGLIHIHVDKKNKKCAAPGSNDCITVTDVPFQLKDPTVIFHPHGLYFDKKASQLYVLNHAFRFGGERVEVWSLMRAVQTTRTTTTTASNSADNNAAESSASSAAVVVVTLTPLRSLTWAAGMFPPSNFTLIPPHLTSNRIPEHGSVWGALNDVTLDRVNNRLLLSVWRPWPLPRLFPRGQNRRDKLAPIVAGLLTNPTVFLSCPADIDSCQADPPIKQCIRSTQRYSMANGINSNEKGDVVFVADLGAHQLHFVQPLPIRNKDDLTELPEHRSLGFHALSYAIDNVELHSDNATHFCVTYGVLQRLIEVPEVEHHPHSATTAGGAASVCCPYTADDGKGGRGVDTAGCVEDVLFLSDGTNKNVQSGLSVAVAIDGGDEAWSGRGRKKLVLTGSWFDKGLGVCWV